jgi:glycosyltransferase involved in cell wall biosynthesis
MLPKVSVIMPVGYGDRYFRVALNCFLSQSYPGEIEIVVLDNSEKPIEHLLPVDDRIKYYRCERMPVGALRNLGTSYSTGEICISGDEDDWSAPNRIESQVGRLLVSKKAVTGFHNILYYTPGGHCYKYRYAAGRTGIDYVYACGSSQCYLKTWWEKHPFPSTGVEDYYFQLEAAQAGQLDSCDAEQLCVARAHDDSVCPIGQYLNHGHQQFLAVSRNDLPSLFFFDIEEESNIKQLTIP